MSTLEIAGLRAAVGGKEILHGIDLTVSSGEVHAVMGPNGAGKSTLSAVVMGRPGYEVLGGSVTLDGVDVLALAPWERAAGRALPGHAVPDRGARACALDDVLARGAAPPGAARATTCWPTCVAEADRIGFDERFLDRPLNVDLSGGEKKRNETLQLAVLQPKIAILDELDSGLDIDALRACTRRVEAMTHDSGLGVLAITHYSRLLQELRARRRARAGRRAHRGQRRAGAGRRARGGGLQGVRDRGAGAGVGHPEPAPATRSPIRSRSAGAARRAGSPR